MYCMNIGNLRSRTGRIDWILESGLINKDVWLAGGSLRTLVDPKETIVDYDLFFKRQEKDIEGSKYNKVPETRTKLEQLGFKCTFECPEGKLYTYEKWIDGTKAKIQLICEYFYNSPEELLSTFDFTPTYFATNGQFLWTNKTAIKSVRNKVCDLMKLTYPVSSIKRLIKYSNKGYQVNDAIKNIVGNLVERGSILSSDKSILSSEEMRVYID